MICNVRLIAFEKKNVLALLFWWGFPGHWARTPIDLMKLDL